MKPTVFEPTPGPLAPDGQVQAVPADEAADVTTTAATIAMSPAAPKGFHFRVMRVMRFLSMRVWGSERLAEGLGRELALPPQQQDEDGEGEDVGERVEDELVDVVAVRLEDVPERDRR